MNQQSNKQGEYFADIVNKFMTNEGKYVDGYDARVVNMFIYKADGVITVKNNTAKVVLIITPVESDKFDFKMRFVNATTHNRLMAIKELLGWDSFNVVVEGGIPFLITNNHQRITLNSGILYSKTELEEMSKTEMLTTESTAL